MSLISGIILIILSIYADNPLSLIGNFIKDLPITRNPDTYLIPPQIIRLHGYPAESHTIQTDDGYLLELHRIPYGKAGKGDEERYPVLLYHGLLCDSESWLLNEPEKSLPYRLADEGYDVWLGNTRGNTFSRAHVKYNPNQRAFWNFSFHEMGVYDCPASIDYVLNQTNHRQLIYIGHSMGSLMYYVMSSVWPEYNNKVRAQISMAPGMAIPHTKSFLYRQLIPIAKPIDVLFERSSDGVIFEHDVLDEMLIKDICSIPTFGYTLCEFILLIAYGGSPRELDENMIPSIYNSIMDGTSIKNLMHVLQMIKPGLLANYNYGESGNLRQYGTPKPPLYNLTNVKVPVRIYYGEGDLLIDPRDVKDFYQKLPNPNGLVKISDKKFSHLDFLWAKDINRLVFDDVIQCVHNFTDSASSLQPNSHAILNNNDFQEMAEQQSFPTTVASGSQVSSASTNFTIFLPLRGST